MTFLVDVNRSHSRFKQIEKATKSLLGSEGGSSTSSGLLGVGQLEARDALEVHHLQHVLGLGVDLDDVQLEGGHVRNVVVSALALLFLQLDGDTSDGGSLETLHLKINKYFEKPFSENDLHRIKEFLAK